MRNTLIHRASSRPARATSGRLPRVTFGRWRASIGAATVVVLLTLLFAVTISAALRPHPLVELTQAVAGGL